jgi:hypothetical protein
VRQIYAAAARRQQLGDLRFDVAIHVEFDLIDRHFRGALDDLQR